MGKEYARFHRAFLSLGTNLGDLKANLDRAIGLINEMAGSVVRRSSYVQTEPWGFESENKFLNACVEVNTPLSPNELLKVTQDIERSMGRTSKSVNRQYHDRVIDIDILLYDNLHISTPDLTIPHPLMHERPFVMQPLKEIY